MRTEIEAEPAGAAGAAGASGTPGGAELSAAPEFSAAADSSAAPAAEAAGSGAASGGSGAASGGSGAGRTDPDPDPAAAADPAPATPRDARIAEIISEFSEIFTFARTRWAKYAESVHPELRGVGLMILQLVLKKSPITATEISQLLDMDKATVSRQVTRLREMGFVEAAPAADDRRVILLTPSEEARAEFVRIRREWAHSYHERFADWELSDLERLNLGLHRFNQSTEDPPRDGPAARCTRDHPAA